MIAHKESGVDVQAGDHHVDLIKPLTKATHNQNVIGGFGGLYQLPIGYNEPVLVSGTDGVGTKVRLAIEADMLEDIGFDLVAMCVNDIATLGAKPLFFMDYYATGQLDVVNANRVVMSIANACKEANMALLGGETAEMPGMYRRGDFDLAGFAVGIIDKNDVVDGRDIAKGDVIIGLESNGLHSNGFSLVRKILADHVVKPDFIRECLRGTKLYDRVLLNLRGNFKGAAHITGGGIQSNIDRIIPEGLKANLNMWCWNPPKVFNELCRMGQLTDEDMLTTFNCGVGMAIVVDPNDVEIVMLMIRNHNTAAVVMGEVQ